MPADLVSTLKLERFRCRGDEALAEWAKLKDEGKGWPVIVGDDKALSRLVDSIDAFALSQTPEQILVKADTLHFPDELRAQHEAVIAELIEHSRRALALPDDKLPKGIDFDEDGDVFDLSVEETRRKIQAEIDSGFVLPIGVWPDKPRPSRMPLTIYDGLEFRNSVNILRVPVASGPEVFASLRWAGVNLCPPSEVHVAALRLWDNRYGAELVALTDDSITLRVQRRPQDPQTAIELVREQQFYCPSSIETIAPTAYGLMTSDWWFFWWD